MSAVVDVDRDHCLNCLGVSYCKMERIKLQFGCYMNKLNCVICFGWMWLFKLLSVLLENVVNQTAIWMLWTNWIVSFALDGCDCSNCWFILMRNCNLAFPADARLRRVFFASEASGPQKSNWNLISVEFGELKKIFFWTYVVHSHILLLFNISLPLITQLGSP